MISGVIPNYKRFEAQLIHKHQSSPVVTKQKHAKKLIISVSSINDEIYFELIRRDRWLKDFNQLRDCACGDLLGCVVSPKFRLPNV